MQGIHYVVCRIPVFSMRLMQFTEVYWKFKKTLIVIQMVQTLHTSANILHIFIHKNVLTMLQQKLHLLVNSE